MADIQRTVEAKLKITEEGDAQAFGDVAAGVDKLKDAAGETADVLPDISSSLKDVTQASEEAGKATEEHAKRVGSLTDILKQCGGEFGKLATSAAAVVGAFTAGYAAGEKLRGILNQLTEGGFDRSIQGMSKGFAEWAVAGDDAAGAARRLVNEMHILKANGIDPVGMSAAEISAKVEGLGQKMQQASLDAAAMEHAYAAWVAKTGLAKPGLDKDAAALVDIIKRFTEANQQLSGTDIAKIFGPQVDALVGKYGLLKAAVLPALQTQIDGWAEAGRAAQFSVDKQGVAVDNLKGKLGSINPLLEKITTGFDNLGKKDMAGIGKGADAAAASIERVAAANAKLDASRVDAMTAAYHAMAVAAAAAGKAAQDLVEGSYGSPGAYGSPLTDPYGSPLTGPSTNPNAGSGTGTGSPFDAPPAAVGYG